MNALILAVLSVFIQLPLSLGLALLLAKGVKGEKIFVAIFFMPVLISTVVIGQLWLKIYNPEYGIVNVALNTLGLEKYARTWLGNRIPHDISFYTYYMAIFRVSHAVDVCGY